MSLSNYKTIYLSHYNLKNFWRFVIIIIGKMLCLHFICNKKINWYLILAMWLNKYCILLIINNNYKLTIICRYLYNIYIYIYTSTLCIYTPCIIPRLYILYSLHSVYNSFHKSILQKIKTDCCMESLSLKQLTPTPKNGVDKEGMYVQNSIA